MRLLLIGVALLSAATAAAAQVPSAQIPEPAIVGGRLGAAYLPLIERLQQGGLVLLFRHERTEVIGMWDFEPFIAHDCDRQRNLSEVGRASARTVGRTIRQLGIPVVRVIASTYCRAVESATLTFGGVNATTPELIGSDGKARTLAMVVHDLGNVIAREVRPGGVLVLIGHHGTSDAVTTRMLDEGDALVLEPVAAGSPRILAHIPAARWEEIARDLDRRALETRRK